MKKLYWYQASLPFGFTAGFACNGYQSSSLVVTTAPILKKFVGQPLKNLIDWVESKNGDVIKLREYKPGIQGHGKKKHK